MNPKILLYFAFDLMNCVIGIFNIWGVCGWDWTRICKDGKCIVHHTHDSQGSEDNGIHDSWRRHKAKPAIYEDKERWEVNVDDGQNDNGYRQREARGLLHFLYWIGVQGENNGISKTVSSGRWLHPQQSGN